MQEKHGINLTEAEIIIIERICLSEIENIMERWHFARENDAETQDKISEYLKDKGLLIFFNE